MANTSSACSLVYTPYYQAVSPSQRPVAKLRRILPGIKRVSLALPPATMRSVSRFLAHSFDYGCDFHRDKADDEHVVTRSSQSTITICAVCRPAASLSYGQILARRQVKFLSRLADVLRLPLIYERIQRNNRVPAGEMMLRRWPRSKPSESSEAKGDRIPYTCDSSPIHALMRLRKKSSDGLGHTFPSNHLAATKAHEA